MTPCPGATLAFWDGLHSAYGMCISKWTRFPLLWFTLNSFLHEAKDPHLGAILEPPSHTWINLNWSWCIHCFIHCLIQFANILCRIFVSMYMRDIGLLFSFIVMCLSDLGIWVILASQNELESIPFASILWKRF